LSQLEFEKAVVSLGSNGIQSTDTIQFFNDLLGRGDDTNVTVIFIEAIFKIYTLTKSRNKQEDLLQLILQAFNADNDYIITALNKVMRSSNSNQRNSPDGMMSFKDVHGFFLDFNNPPYDDEKINDLCTMFLSSEGNVDIDYL